MMHVILSLTGLARLILILLVVYAIYSFLIRVVIPLAVSNYLKNLKGNHYQDATPKDPKREGEISIQYNSDQASTGNNRQNEGEYVDYEELK
jgi:flagellar basal body-associated protein FliL